ncbi:MAG: triose-phosphate isomerase [Actinobacteria bacterium]|nr:triose-phosphate isomerase [Actinomycetota bacterium]
MARKPLIAGNWKMFKTHLEAIKLVQQLGYELAGHDLSAAEVAVCPPFTSLRTVQTLMEDDRMEFALGAQNMHSEDEGAFTGEVSPVMLQALRVRYVILGHSERRELLGETDEGVNQKAKAAFKHELTPIMCCGETEAEREGGLTQSKVEGQVRKGLAGVKDELVARSVIAYEPIWAIGTGKTATPDDAQETVSFIRSVIAKQFGDEEVGTAIRILYGGSVKAGNAKALFDQPDIDGGLVGGASLDAGEFAAIVKSAL